MQNTPLFRPKACPAMGHLTLCTVHTFFVLFFKLPEFFGGCTGPEIISPNTFILNQSSIKMRLEVTS
jgi:hypothetical protein